MNRGTNYFGTTVFLDSDLSLAGKSFEPIGIDSKYFNGTFDGQGYVISNLAMNFSLQYVGLFGYSRGHTIKNVVIDYSCSFASSFTGNNNVRVGGIIGHCYAENGPCAIENSVNMGSVTFDGNTAGNYGFSFFGGIAGRLSSYKYDITVKNCANN